MTTVDQILAALRACKTIAEVNAVAVKYKDAVSHIAADPEQSVRAIHIRNLAAYKRRELARA